ncbi:hypothetical protein [Rubrivivax rivuli]|nr:hypothetical protein [Rubrivivax rivuli]
MLLDRPHPSHTVERLLALIQDREAQPDEPAAVLALPLSVA